MVNQVQIPRFEDKPIECVDCGVAFNFEAGEQSYTFVGISPNALKTQIWTALIALLLLKYLQFRSKFNLPLCRLVALLRLNLFSYRNFWDWLDDPFETPPELPNPQLRLAF